MGLGLVAPASGQRLALFPSLPPSTCAHAHSHTRIPTHAHARSLPPPLPLPPPPPPHPHPLQVLNTPLDDGLTYEYNRNPRWYELSFNSDFQSSMVLWNTLNILRAIFVGVAWCLVSPGPCLCLRAL